MAPTPVLLPGESHGQRGLEGYSPGGHKESGTTERLSTARPVIGTDSYLQGENRDADAERRRGYGRGPRRLGQTGRAASTNTYHHVYHKSVQFSPTLCDPMDRSTPGLPVHHQLPDTYMV